MSNKADNSPVTVSESSSSRVRFGNIEIDSLNVQAAVAVAIAVFVGLVGLLQFSGGTLTGTSFPEEVNLYTVSSGEEMIDLLKQNGLWDIDGNDGVSPLVFAAYPSNINNLSIDVKKKIFFHTLLPAALVVLGEVKKEKDAFHSILARFPNGHQSLTFSDDYGVWGRGLTVSEIEFVLSLVRKYRSNRASELVSRINLVPLSMIMAQAAIESSWGTSRFAREGNNLFGIWTWGEKGMVPEGRDDGLSHKVAAYDSILDSVSAYVLTLNRLPAYRSFRNIRSNTMNSIELAEGLIYYSQRRDRYVWEVKDFIRYNKLDQYDSCFLAERPLVLKNVENVRLTSRRGKKAA